MSQVLQLITIIHGKLGPPSSLILSFLGISTFSFLTQNPKKWSNTNASLGKGGDGAYYSRSALQFFDPVLHLLLSGFLELDHCAIFGLGQVCRVELRVIDLIGEFATIAWKHHHLPSPPCTWPPSPFLCSRVVGPNPKEKRKKQRETNVDSAWVTTSRADQFFQTHLFFTRKMLMGPPWKK